MNTTSIERLEQSLDRVVAWVQAHRYRAYEPADGNSSILFPLTAGKVLPMRALQASFGTGPTRWRSGASAPTRSRCA